MIQQKEMINEEEKQHTFCHRCGRLCNGKSSSKFILCKKCNIFTAIGSSSFYSKGGTNQMVAKKSAKKIVSKKSTKTAAESSVKDKSFFMESAAKVKDFIDSTFSACTKAEKLKINHEYWKILKSE